MSMFPAIGGIVLRLFLGVTSLLLLFFFCSVLFSPSLTTNTASSSFSSDQKAREAELAVLEDQSVDPDHIMRVQVDVDYSEGKNAAWYPKEESPILTSLVEKGELPPVAKRVGEEPLVLKGLHGVSNYGGTMYRLNGFPGPRVTPIHLVRFSPQGFPLVPNVAKSWSISKDGRRFTFTLRKGMKWSDGHPFTSADILYWWEREQCDKSVSPDGPMSKYLHRGKPMTVEAPDPQTVVFAFADPYFTFLATLASSAGYYMTQSPRHFLLLYHPELGDQQRIQDVMQRHNLISKRAVYMMVRNRVERPSIAPWIRRTEQITPPDTMVRNPYYWGVDTEGRQLPYMDRMVATEKSKDMVVISAAQGEVTVQARYLRNEDYTLLMRQRQTYGYQLHHWTNGGGSTWAMAFNLNRRVPQGDREAADKAKLLADKRFRQALSLAVDRQTIIQALFGGKGSPHAVGPASTSPFHFSTLQQNYSRFDSAKAEEMLDTIGLTERDPDGFRRFPGGPSLLFDINYCAFTGEGAGQFIVEDWRQIGIHARMRAQDRSLFYVEKVAGIHDISVWGGYGAYFPLLDLRYYCPLNSESNFAIRNATWYTSGGMFNKGGTVRGTPLAKEHPLYQALLLNEQIKQAPTFTERRTLFGELLKLTEENVYVLNITTPLPTLAVVKNGVKNVPLKGVYSWPFQSPANLGLETWCYAEPKMSAAEIRDITHELSHITPVRPLHGIGVQQPEQPTPSAPAVTTPLSRSAASLIGPLIRYGIWLALLLLLIMLIFRFPFVGHRLLIMIPTLILISIITFVVIELPPGDAISSKIMQMQEAGGDVNQKEIDEMKTLFRIDESAWDRYAWWIGLDWFATHEGKDEGLLQGNMGRSMMDLKPVNDKVGDRLLFTFLISLSTILFTWAVALPIGIYSAVRQYSFFDYLFTVGGFIGMCIPGFLLALLLMFAAESWFGISVSGLFSPEYATQSEWSQGKVMDLLRHIWLPIFVQGVAGTAGMIRVMRANLLDELQKPYVVTARAKGLRPMKLLFKYPIRLAFNPFISGIGNMFPELISGGAIIAIVLSLPTIEPMQLNAVMQQDMYLAGSILMLLSLLSVLGTLFSDIMLIIFDPRIRTAGGWK
ncbi:ABC-type dipeptide/oligopeptide/nickel transport system, permease component [Candidatus Electrothrix aarhusensis]